MMEGDLQKNQTLGLIWKMARVVPVLDLEGADCVCTPLKIFSRKSH